MHRPRVMQLLLAAILCLLASSTPTSAGRKRQRLLAGIFNTQKIVGGQDTTIMKYPFIVSVEKYFTFAERWFHDCGGSILNKRNILSAAHCIQPDPKAAFRIRAGTSTRGKGGLVLKVAQVFYHPKHDPVNIDYDVGFFRLAHDLWYTRKVQSIQLPTLDWGLVAGASYEILGWGAEGATSLEYPEKLQRTEVSVIDHAACIDSYKNVRKVSHRMFCAAKPGKDTCTGDSGGPLARRDARGRFIQYGLTSWGEGCADAKQPGVYVNLANPEIRAYISKVLKTKTSAGAGRRSRRSANL